MLSPLPIGSNTAWAWLNFSGLLFLMMAFWCQSYIKEAKGNLCCIQATPGKFSVGFFGCAIVWVILQSVPLTFAGLAQLSTPTALIYKETISILAPQNPSKSFYISIDPSITYENSFLSAAYFCLYLLLLLVIDSRTRLRTLCYVIVFSGLFQAAFGSFMALSGLEYLFFTKKYTYIGNATGTFVSRNNFAGYLEMTLATGVGLMMVDRKSHKAETFLQWRGKLRNVLNLLLSGKALFRLMLIIMVIGLILSRSRMGNASFFCSLLMTGLISSASSPSFRKPGVAMLLASIIAIDILLLGKWFGIEKVVQRMEQTTLERETRDDVVQFALPMIGDFGWTGTGAGTFWYMFSSYAGESRLSGFYKHAHNDYIELLSDLGYICFSFLSGVVLISLWQALKAIRHPRSSFVRGMGFAGFMGTLSILIHSFTDFNLQIPANAMLFIAMLAIPTIALSVEKNSSEE